MADLGASQDLQKYNQYTTVSYLLNSNSPPNSPTYPQTPTTNYDGRELHETTMIDGATPPANALPLPIPITYYKMNWFDVDCITPTWRSWIAPGGPDPTGSYYSGPKCGATPITGATISFSWRE